MKYSTIKGVIRQSTKNKIEKPKMKIDNSHSHSIDAVNAINQALDKSNDMFEILYILLTEWSDDEDLLDMADFLETRLEEQ